MGAWFRRFGAIAVFGLVFSAVPSPGEAGAPALPERTIVIDLVAPPSLEGALQAGLWLDGVDVTDEYCQTSTAGPSNSGGAVLRCDDLPDGTDYRVGLVEPIPVGTSTMVECGDGTGTRTQAPSIPRATPLDGWDCQLWASSPSIVLDLASPLLLADDLPAPIEWVVRDLAGNVVSSACEPAELFGRPFVWCSDLVLGDHTVELVPPAGYLGDVLCEAVGTSSVSWTGTFELTAGTPIWKCEVVSFGAPLSVDINILDPLAPSWTDDLSLVVERMDGLDVSDFCEIIDISEFEQGEIWTHTGRADCPGLPAGTYDVTFGGVPDEVTFGAIGGTPCRTEVTETTGAGCLFEFRAARDIPPGTTPPPGQTAPTVAPTGALPATGSPPRFVPATAVALLIAGAALITITRRRPRSASAGDL